jgi:hypothetical protein
MTLINDPQTNERIYELRCHCGDKGGEIRFPEKHGRESDQALQTELDAKYTHTCQAHTEKVL